MPPSHQPPGPGRRLLAGGLVLAMLLLGQYDNQLLAMLTAGWQRAFEALGLTNIASTMQQSIDAGIIKRMLPAVATYAALYLSICLLLLYLLLAPAQWRLAWRLYAGAMVAYVLITILGKLAGNIQWAYRLSRHLLDFVVSPLPVAGLYVLLRAGFGPTAPGVLARPVPGSGAITEPAPD